MVALGIAGVVIVGGAIALLVARTDGGAPRYELAPVERADLDVRVTATGTLQPTDEVEVSSELSGIVRTVLVDANDPVRKGEPLAELDTLKLEAEIAAARATLDAARAKVREAEATVAEALADVQRYRQLAQQSIETQQKLSQAEAAYARAKAVLGSARANVAVAEAELRSRETDLEKACICSPIDGIVLQRNVDPGQTVAATLQAPVLFTVAEDLRSMELRVDVDEADVSLVEAGQQARFTVDAHPDRSFPATVTKVLFAPETTEGVVTYEAQLTVDNGELLLRPGMTATAEIAVRTVKDALLVPNEALRFQPPMVADEPERRGLLAGILPRPPGRAVTRRPEDARGAKSGRVYVLEDGEPVAVPVAIGLSDGQRTEITSAALDAGRRVVIDVHESAS
jgi:HlyD family secretion protein